MVLYNFLREFMLPLKEIDTIAPQKGKIIDLGCGHGIIASYLAANPKRSVIGVDLNDKRMPKSSLKNLQFIKADIRSYNTKDANTIIISDVMHHLSPEDQNILLKKISATSKKGDVIIVKEIDSSEKLRSRLSRLWDFIFYPQDNIYYSNSKSFPENLNKLGFHVSLTRPCRFFPGSTTLYKCVKS